ncbi:hypothetical protein KXW76_006869 [Aspergillus fumigatus]|nr:hypothetical protein KXW76_006869 [Aspergillus fumigatus]
MNISSDVSTPAMLEGMPVGEIDFNAAFEAIMTSNSMLENQQYHFEPNAFDLMNQVQNDYNKTALYQQLSLPEGQIGENFEFTDFISDCF